MKVISIFNRKGGVGKTSICFALAAFYGGTGKRVLCLDCDSQMNLTQALTSINKRENIKYYFFRTISDVIKNDKIKLDKKIIHEAGRYFFNENITKVCYYKTFENVYFISGSRSIEKDAQNLELNAPKNAWKTILKEKLEQIKDDFDIVLIDNPPSESPITIMSLAASDCTIAPTMPDIASTNGLVLCQEVIEKAKKINPELKDLGCFLNNYKSRETQSVNTYETLTREAEYHFTGLTVRSASKIPTALAERKGIINTARYLEKLPQTSNVAEDLITLGNFILKNA